MARFANRAFLEMDPDRGWPYSLHSILRDAIRQADMDMPDSWSDRERREAAARIGAYLERAADTAAGAGDRSTQVAAVRQAFELCLLTDQFFEWLAGAAQKLLACGGWGLLPDLPTDGGGPVAALALGLQGARERRSGQLGNSVSLLNTALGYAGLPPRLRRFLLLHRAHALRVAGRYADASADYEQLWQALGDFRQDAGYWLADYRFLQGQFGAALTSLDQLNSQSAELRGEILRLQGHVYRVNAMFDRAEARYREALELARDTASAAAEGKALTDLIQTLAWHRPADALDLRQRATEINEALRNQVEIVKIDAATAVALTKNGQPGQAAAHIDHGLSLAQDCGYPGGLVWCQVARAASQLQRGDLDGARESAGRLAVITEDLQGNRFWSEIVNWWSNENAQPDHGAQWLDGPQAARARWLAAGPRPVDADPDPGQQP